jgi:hypothetical protein
MRLLATALLCLALAACGNDAPKPAKRIDTPQEAVSRVGDITIRANVLPTANLNDIAARSYGIERSERTALLLVSVRRGPEGQDTALPATIQATATNLHGQRQEIAMREVRTGELVDYVGTADASPPETLTFDLKILREGAAATTMTFSRDFEP